MLCTHSSEIHNESPKLIIVSARSSLRSCPAASFAAKEAVFKAHPHRRLTWHDIVIFRETAGSSSGSSSGSDGAAAGESGPPGALIKGQAEGPGDEGGPAYPDDQIARVSISHDGDYATAVCVGFDPARMGRQA